MRKMQNKFKVGIGALAFASLMVYTYFITFYGGKFLNGTEYALSGGIILLFTVAGILSSKLLFEKNKTVSVILTAVILIAGFFTISEYVGSSYRCIGEMLVSAVWPLLCCALSKYINIGDRIGYKPFVCDFTVYNVITAALIFLFEEILFKYEFFSADVVSQLYMYVMAIAIFLMYRIKSGKTVPDINDIVCIIIVTGVTLALWINWQERIVFVIQSLDSPATETDAYGDPVNWFSYRISMLKIAVSGDFSKICKYFIDPMVKGCSLMWLSASNVYAAVLIAAVVISLVILMLVYARKSSSFLVRIIAVSFVFKLVIGIFANLFLVFSTTTGLPLIRNVYDIIPVAVLIANFSDNLCTEKISNQIIENKQKTQNLI